MIQWKSISGYEGLYKISSHGDIERAQHVMTNRLAKNGYLRIGLCKNGKVKVFTVHRLVAEHFIPNPERKPYVNHKNGIKTDNRVENLEWCTQSENMLHAFRIGLQRGNDGERNGHAKLSNRDAVAIRQRSAETLDTLAKDFNVSRSTVRRILHNQTFKQTIQ